MWKWLIVLALLVILLIPTPVLADSSGDITVTAVGWIADAPGGLTLIYISDYEVGISWTKGEGAVNTMVRVKYGSIPESRDDGYLIYYGEGITVTDSNIDLTASRIPYYRVWSQNSVGVWEEVGVTKEANFMSISFLYLGLALVVLVLTVLAFILKNSQLHMVCVLAWILFGFFMWNANWPEGNTYLPVAATILAGAMVLAHLVNVVNHYLGLRTEPPTHDSIQADYRRKVLDVTRRRGPREW